MVPVENEPPIRQVLNVPYEPVSSALAIGLGSLLVSATEPPKAPSPTLDVPGPRCICALPRIEA